MGRLDACASKVKTIETAGLELGRRGTVMSEKIYNFIISGGQ